jgi:hypothetical protein
MKTKRTASDKFNHYRELATSKLYEDTLYNVYDDALDTRLRKEFEDAGSELPVFPQVDRTVPFLVELISYTNKRTFGIDPVIFLQLRGVTQNPSETDYLELGMELLRSTDLHILASAREDVQNYMSALNNDLSKFLEERKVTMIVDEMLKLPQRNWTNRLLLKIEEDVSALFENEEQRVERLNEFREQLARRFYEERLKTRLNEHAQLQEAWGQDIVRLFNEDLFTINPNLRHLPVIYFEEFVLEYRSFVGSIFNNISNLEIQWKKFQFYRHVKLYKYVNSNDQERYQILQSDKYNRDIRWIYQKWRTYMLRTLESFNLDYVQKRELILTQFEQEMVRQRVNTLTASGLMLPKGLSRRDAWAEYASVDESEFCHICWNAVVSSSLTGKVPNFVFVESGGDTFTPQQIEEIRAISENNPWPEEEYQKHHEWAMSESFPDTLSIEFLEEMHQNPDWTANDIGIVEQWLETPSSRPSKYHAVHCHIVKNDVLKTKNITDIDKNALEVEIHQHDHHIYHLMCLSAWAIKNKTCPEARTRFID